MSSYPRDGEIKLCQEHADPYIKHWGANYLSQTLIKIVTTDKCELCIEEYEERCPTCNKRIKP